MARPGLNHRAANPYTWLLYTHLLRLGDISVVEYSARRLLTERVDLLHVHWPEGDLNQPDPGVALRRSLKLLAAVRWARSRGTRIIWTAHNLHAHERLHPRLERWFWRAFIPQVDAYISLSHSGAASALARFPVLAGVPSAVVPAGHYRDAYGAPMEKSAARDRLGIARDARVVSFVGQVRRYKNVPRLIEVFRGLDDPAAVLLVAGESNSECLTRECETAAADDQRIRLQLRWIPDAELQSYAAVADLVVLPFGSVLNSGSAVFALSFDRPVLAPALGALVDLANEVGESWMRTYRGELTTECLRTAMAWAAGSRSGRAPLDALEWDSIAADTLQAYRTVLTAVGR